MALIKCPECKKRVSNKAETCPNCGYSIKAFVDKKSPQKSSLGAILFSVGAIILFYMIYIHEPELSQEEFKKLKPGLITDINKKINNKKFDEAITLASKYDYTKDANLVTLIHKAEENKLYEKIRKIPARELEKNKEGYLLLTKLNPKSSLYKHKYNFYDQKIKEAKIVEKEKVIKTVETIQLDEGRWLLTSPIFIFVDLPNNYEEIKIKGSGSFKVWDKINWPGGNVKELSIEYDKIWKLEDTRNYSSYEINKKYKGQLDIHEVYWKNNQIQAYIVKRHYSQIGRHKISDIFDRNYFLEAFTKN